MSRRSRTSLAGLLARQFRSDLGPLLAMAAIVLVVATLAATAPLALRAMTTAEVQYRLDSYPAVRRSLLTTVAAGPLLNNGGDPYQEMYAGLAGITGSAQTPLRAAMADADFIATTGELPAQRLDGAEEDPISTITINIAPHLAEHIRIIEGSAPGPFTRIVDPKRVPPPPQWSPRIPGTLIVPSQEVEPPDPALDKTIDIMLSAVTAAKAEWPVGEVRRVDLRDFHSFRVKLSGIFEPIDPGDPYWAMAPSALEPGLARTSPEVGNILIVTGGAFIDPGSWPVMASEIPGIVPNTTAGIPLSTVDLTVDQIEELLPQLRYFMGLSYTVGPPSDQIGAQKLIFNSEAGDFLTAALQRAATATVVLVMVASGPIGVAIAALWLLSRLIVLRRRPALALASARGASGWQLRATQALQCLLLSAPAAAIGAGMAYALFPASWSLVSIWFAAMAAIVPPALLALAASPRSLRSTRGDVDPRARGRFRWVLEVVVLALTALAVYLLLQRGLTTNSGTVDIDPLLAATPLLLALSAGLIVLRLYPLPLIGLARWLKPRRGIVAFLGANRSIRDPAAGLAPVLAMVVGLAVAVFSGVLLGTVSHGVTTAAHSTVGADMRIDSPPLWPNQMEAIAAIPGVEEIAGIYEYSRLKNLSVEENISVPTLLADTAALARVQAGVPGTAQIRVDMTKKVGDAMPALLSPSLAAQYAIGENSSLGDADIVTAGESGTSTSLSGVADWVLVDKTFSPELGVYNFVPKIVLMKLDPGADVAAVARAAAEIAGPDSLVRTPADVAHQLQESPVSAGLQLALLALAAIVALLCAATIVLALLTSGPARERLLALLRTLGLTPAQARGILSWEIGPTAIVAIVTGSVLGATLPLVVLAGVDLRSFTGGSIQPAVSIDPVLLAIVIGGFSVLVLVATAIAMAAARRVSMARTLRTSEEG